VGRHRELEALEDALAAARNGSRRLAVVAGEAGIGKTRLVEELARRAAASGAVVLWGRCHEGEGAPAFWPWVEVVRASTKGRRPEQLRRALGPGVADVAQVVPEVRELFPGEEPSPPLAPDAARFRLYDSLARFFGRLAATAPLVIILDGLQWADAPSLELLEFLAARPDEAAILVVGTYRDTEVVAPQGSHVSRVELRGLDMGELATLLASASGGVDPTESMVDAVRHRPTATRSMSRSSCACSKARAGSRANGRRRSCAGRCPPGSAT
jgi:predicted ATPase